MPLCDLQFVDLYLGRSHGQAFCDVKALPGADAPRLPLPEELEVEVQAVRERLEATYRESGRPEFPLNHEGVLYRVTTFENPGDPAPFFTLSRVEAKIFPFARLNLPEHVASAVLASQTRGLVLIAGSMSSGKTSSAASILSERLRRHGGFAMAFEDPIETMLDGMHGDGRCMRVEVSRHTGGYGEALTRALRARVGTMLVGEIRDGDTAEQTLRMASTDHLIFSTIHADSPAAAIELLYTYARKSHVENAAALVARGLSVVIWQRLIRQAGGGASVLPECLSLLGEDDRGALKALIAAADFAKLTDLIEGQQRRALYGAARV